MKLLAILIALSFSPVAVSAQYAPAAPPSDGVLGYWSTDAGSILQVHDCGGNVCITIMTISQKAPGVVDAHNPDPALRTRPVCHLNIGTDLKLKDANHAENGKIYDPETGKTYRSAISSHGNVLTVRGYIGIRALGRSETWNRTTARSATCVGVTHR